MSPANRALFDSLWKGLKPQVEAIRDGRVPDVDRDTLHGCPLCERLFDERGRLRNHLKYGHGRR